MSEPIAIGATQLADLFFSKSRPPPNQNKTKLLLPTDYFLRLLSKLVTQVTVASNRLNGVRQVLKGTYKV